MKNTKIVTGKCRFSYAYLFEPQEPINGGEPKYNVTLLIPKSDTATMAKIKQAIADARENFCERNGANALPPKPVNPVNDGDSLKDNGEAFGPECKGCYVLRAKSSTKPVIVDAFRNEITNPTEVYSGCYGRAALKFVGYNKAGQKGITAVLLSVQKLSDGEPFGTVGSANDFDDDFRDDDEVDFM